MEAKRGSRKKERERERKRDRWHVMCHRAPSRCLLLGKEGKKNGTGHLECVSCEANWSKRVNPVNAALQNGTGPVALRARRAFSEAALPRQ